MAYVLAQLWMSGAFGERTNIWELALYLTIIVKTESNPEESVAWIISPAKNLFSLPSPNLPVFSFPSLNIESRTRRIEGRPFILS